MNIWMIEENSIKQMKKKISRYTIVKSNQNQNKSNQIKIKIKNRHVHNLYDWKMSQKLPGNNLKWIKDTSQFIEDFKKL